MSTLVLADQSDSILTGDVIVHLEAQMVAARQLLGVVLKQGAAIRERDVQAVVAWTGTLQAELLRRQLIENDRTRLLERAGVRLGVSAGSVTLSLLEQLMDPESAQAAREQSLELRGLLEEIKREHTCNRALMHQELAFLDHLLRLADSSCDIGYDAAGARPTATLSMVSGQRRVFDARA